MGIATLRMAMLPTEVPPDRREMVLMAGAASYMMATRMTDAAGKAFEGLVARYPETPNIHYAYGVFLLIEQPAKAIEEFKRELEIQPNDPESLMQIAYQNLKDSDPASALPWAKQAVDAAPNVFASHRALGEALVGTGDVEGGIAQLAIAIRQAPDSPGTHFALAKAYQRAGRANDAAKERAEFIRLDRLARTNRSGSQSVGGIDMERLEPGTTGSRPVIRAAGGNAREAKPAGCCSHHGPHRSRAGCVIRRRGSAAHSDSPRGHGKHRRERGIGGRRCPRQARHAGQGSAARRFRGARGRRAADDRLVSRDLRRFVRAGCCGRGRAGSGARGLGARRRPSARSQGAARHGPGLRPAQSRSARTGRSRGQDPTLAGRTGKTLPRMSACSASRDRSVLSRRLRGTSSRLKKASTRCRAARPRPSGSTATTNDKSIRQAEASQQTVDAATSGAGPAGREWVRRRHRPARADGIADAHELRGTRTRPAGILVQVNSLFAIIEALRPLPRAKERRAVLGRRVDPARRAAPVHRGHRCREPRERQYLHDGRRRTPYRRASRRRSATRSTMPASAAWRPTHRRQEAVGTSR